MRKRIVAILACLTAVLLLLPATAWAADFTPNAWLDDDGVLHWDAEGEYYSRIDLGDLMFGPDSSDACEKPVNGEYTYDIENLFQAAEQLYGSIGDGDVSGLNDSHPVTFVYYERQPDGTMKEVGRAKDAYTYTYTTGQLVKLATPGNLSWTGDGFTASWDTVEHAEGYWVRLYETTSGGTSAVRTKTVEGNTFQLTSIVTTPKDGATYAFEVRAIGPAGDAQYVTSDWSAKSVESAAWKTPVVEYGLFVGGTEVTSANAADVLGDGTVSYDPNSQTLALKNAKVTKGEHEDAAIYYEGGDLSIVLEGNNVVTGPDDEPNNSSYSYSYGIRVEKQGNISISGDGTLTVRGGKASTQYAGAFSYGIKADGNVKISGGTITAEGGAVSAMSSTNSSNGICANQGIVISGGVVTATGGTAATQSYGLYAANGGVTLSGGELTATGGQVNEGIVSKSLAISANTGVTVEPSSGERIAVVAGVSEAGATELEGSPFDTTTTITDLVNEERYVKAAASSIPAVQRYDIWVEGIQVTSANASDVLGDADKGATVSYDAQTNTLTLDHADLTNTPESPQYPLQIVEPNLTVKLVGENTVSSSAENYPAVHIAPSQGETKIIGDGAGAKLTVTSDVSEGIRVDWSDLAVQDCTVFIRTDVWGGLIVSGGVLAIRDAQVDVASIPDPEAAEPSVYVLEGGKGISITNSTVTVSNGAREANVIYSDADISIDGSTVTATGTADDAYPAIYAAGDINVTDGTVTAKSAGMRGIFTEADMTVSSNSKVTASGTTDEGTVVVGKLKVENSSLHASTSSDQDMMMALVTEQLEVVASDVTLEGGLDLFAWNDGSTDNASFVIEPGAGKLAEFKVDGQNRDGSAAVHFREEGANSPYDARAELTDAQINWLGAYRYVHIGEHVHEGGAATCARPAVCDDCGREYGVVDSDAHSFTHYVSNGDATCTEDSTETATCDNGCGATDTRTAEGSATGHSFVDGVCSVCGVEDPDYVGPEVPEQDIPDSQDPENPDQEDSDSDKSGQGSAESGSASEKNDPSIPATGDASTFFSAVPALVGATAVAAGVALRRRR